MSSNLPNNTKIYVQPSNRAHGSQESKNSNVNLKSNNGDCNNNDNGSHSANNNNDRDKDKDNRHNDIMADNNTQSENKSNESSNNKLSSNESLSPRSRKRKQNELYSNKFESKEDTTDDNESKTMSSDNESDNGSDIENENESENEIESMNDNTSDVSDEMIQIPAKKRQRLMKSNNKSNKAKNNDYVESGFRSFGITSATIPKRPKRGNILAPTHWQCKLCTFHNKLVLRYCAMCDLARTPDCQIIYPTAQEQHGSLSSIFSSNSSSNSSSSNSTSSSINDKTYKRRNKTTSKNNDRRTRMGVMHATCRIRTEPVVWHWSEILSNGAGIGRGYKEEGLKLVSEAASGHGGWAVHLSSRIFQSPDRAIFSIEYDCPVWYYCQPFLIDARLFDRHHSQSTSSISRQFAVFDRSFSQYIEDNKSTFCKNGMVKDSKCKLIFVIDYKTQGNYHCSIYVSGFKDPVYYVSNLPKKGVYFATEMKGCQQCKVELLSKLPENDRDKKHRRIEYQKQPGCFTRTIRYESKAYQEA